MVGAGFTPRQDASCSKKTLKFNKYVAALSVGEKGNLKGCPYVRQLHQKNIEIIKYESGLSVGGKGNRKGCPYKGQKRILYFFNKMYGFFKLLSLYLPPISQSR